MFITSITIILLLFLYYYSINNNKYNYFLSGSESESEEQLSQEDYPGDLEDEMFYLRADIYSCGQVVAYTLTGKIHWHGRNSVSVKGIQNNLIQKDDRVEVPEELGGQLRNVIQHCRMSNPEERPTAEKLVMHYFSGKKKLLWFRGEINFIFLPISAASHPRRIMEGGGGGGESL